MKMALVHDYLAQDGGAERVLKAFHEIWPEAPIFVLFHDKNKIKAEPKSGWTKTKITNNKTPLKDTNKRLNSLVLDEAAEKYLAKNKIKTNFMNSTG